MKNRFEQMRFTVESTNDGSPTLRLPDQGESMHHSGGAASETFYIYKSVIQEASQLLERSKTCVVGLGLGYIEISWAQVIPNTEAHSLVSFEIEESLRQNFMSWLELPTDALEHTLYDDIYQSLKEFGISAPQIQVKQHLKQNFQLNPIEHDLRDFVSPSKPLRWNIVCYDAFSSKTNQDLWTEDFLQKFIDNHCEEDCVFTTYACTGILKRVLVSRGFEFVKRTRFKGKSDSTLALRGKLKAYLPNFYQTS
ncbi:MnmC family methyltransferase [Pseudobdellovibrio exovorus]|uniref:MnmC-like methyltransferase domain-containing protein n=1 Tax=Pseudobdellovibrio exovorus JSS TaxID=1184267 RepID=M4V837_9BACT|nr:MnmC family methyltransferase [Pseudobdellovibrio exovorus]AGH95547.1 hypothetical protein A11Q_1331 [Pseudobdellovibrio exovorus JSS]